MSTFDNLSEATLGVTRDECFLKVLKEKELAFRIYCMKVSILGMSFYGVAWLMIRLKFPSVVDMDLRSNLTELLRLIEPRVGRFVVSNLSTRIDA